MCVAGSRYRDTTGNLRTQLLRIIRRVGLEPWGRLFHNMQASRQTELTDEFPAHVVADWLGNTPEVADRHCLQKRPRITSAGPSPGRTPTRPPGWCSREPNRLERVRNRIWPTMKKARFFRAWLHLAT